MYTDFKAWSDHYMELIAPSIRTSTLSVYRRHCSKYIVPYFKDKELQGIQPADASGFLENLRSSGLGPNTVGSVYALFHRMSKTALADGIITDDPCRYIHIKGTVYTGQRSFSNVEMQRLTRMMEKKDLDIRTAMLTGMRLGEICALKRTDIDVQESTITVQRTVQRIRNINGGTRLMIGTPKTEQSCRIIPIPDALAKELSAQSGEYIFGGSKPLDPRTLQRHFSKLMHGAGIKNGRFHTLRHTFATTLIESGVDIKTVSSLLGHSSVRTTLEIYVHSSLDARRKAVEMLSNIYTNGKHTDIV